MSIICSGRISRSALTLNTLNEAKEHGRPVVMIVNDPEVFKKRWSEYIPANVEIKGIQKPNDERNRLALDFYYYMNGFNAM